MAHHTYTACYVHLIWGTKQRMPLLKGEDKALAVRKYIYDYARQHSVNVLALYVNPDHVHLLMELPTHMTIENIVKTIKGASSHWINQNDITAYKFAWAVGYAAFTVSHTNVEKVKKYIKNQKTHHQVLTFKEEYERLLKSIHT